MNSSFPYPTQNILYYTDDQALQEIIEDQEEQQEEQGSYSISISIMAVTSDRAFAPRKHGCIREESTEQVNYQ